MLADPPEPAHQVGHIGAEYPVVDVEFVDHQPAQPLEKGRPAGVLGQQPGMEHVRIGEDHASLVPQSAPLRSRSVAVVHSRHHIARPRTAQGVAESAELVLCQRLGGEQQERGGAGIGKQRLDQRDDVRHRLARGRACGDDHVLTGPQEVDGRGLVAIQPLHTPILQEPPDRFRKR